MCAVIGLQSTGEANTEALIRDKPGDLDDLVRAFLPPPALSAPRTRPPGRPPDPGPGPMLPPHLALMPALPPRRPARLLAAPRTHCRPPAGRPAAGLCSSHDPGGVHPRVRLGCTLGHRHLSCTAPAIRSLSRAVGSFRELSGISGWGCTFQQHSCNSCVLCGCRHFPLTNGGLAKTELENLELMVGGARAVPCCAVCCTLRCDERALRCTMCCASRVPAQQPVHVSRPRGTCRLAPVLMCSLEQVWSAIQQWRSMIPASEMLEMAHQDAQKAASMAVAGLEAGPVKPASEAQIKEMRVSPSAWRLA